MVGRLEMRRGPLRETFSTRTVLIRPREITLSLVEGPFKTFEGRWTFKPLGDRGSKVSLFARFEFANPVLDVLLSRTFEKICPNSWMHLWHAPAHCTARIERRGD